MSGLGSVASFASRAVSAASLAHRSTQAQTVYLSHVKWVTGERQLEKYFSRFGRVKNVKLFFDPKTGLHRGFASLTFETADGAEAALRMRPHVIDGDRVNVELYIPMKSKSMTFAIESSSKPPAPPTPQ